MASVAALTELGPLRPGNVVVVDDVLAPPSLRTINLRTNPYERADITSNTYYDWIFDHLFLFIPAQTYVAQMLQSFAEFPPRQKSASFNLDHVMATLQEGAKSD